MLYIGGDDGIYRWFAGTPWPIFHSLQGVAVVGLASPGGGTLVALDAASKVWESTNNGIEWRSIPLPDSAGRPTSLTLLKSAEIVVATARPFGLHRRPIGLVSETDAPSAFARARKLEEAMIGGAKILATKIRKSGTATLARPVLKKFHGWTEMAIPSFKPGAIPSSIRTLAAHEGVLYASIAGQGLWTSGDIGQSWVQVAGVPEEIYAIRFAPGTTALGTSDGVKISADGGRSWVDHSAGLEQVRQVRALEIQPGNSKVMLAGVAPKGRGEGPVADRRGLRFALFESKDAGKTWKHVTRGFPEVLESDSISDIRYLPDEPTSAAIALASGEMWSTSSDGVWWEPLARQIRSARVLCVTP